jgi:hypothetical protein
MDMTKMEISRRQFVVASAAVGGGLMIGFSTGKAHAAAVSNYPSQLPTDKEGVEINAWLTIIPKASSPSAFPTRNRARAL